MSIQNIKYQRHFCLFRDLTTFLLYIDIHDACFILTLKKNYLFIYFWPCWVIVAAHELSLIAVRRRYSLISVHRLLIAVASLV